MTRAPWYIAGPLLGVLIVLLRAAVNKPLGAFGGYADLVAHARRPRQLGLGAFLVLGMAIGGALFANAVGIYRPTFAYAPGAVLPSGSLLQAGVLILAGIAMGVGARTAGGCTSGHGLSGVSVGSPASLVATMTFMMTAIALAHVFAWM